MFIIFSVLKLYFRIKAHLFEYKPRVTLNFVGELVQTNLKRFSQFLSCVKHHFYDLGSHRTRYATFANQQNLVIIKTTWGEGETQRTRRLSKDSSTAHIGPQIRVLGRYSSSSQFSVFYWIDQQKAEFTRDLRLAKRLTVYVENNTNPTTRVLMKWFRSKHIPVH